MHKVRSVDYTGPGSAIPHPAVSVVIPALNEARNLEIVLVDGHSVDDTVAVARPPDAAAHSHVPLPRAGPGWSDEQYAAGV